MSETAAIRKEAGPHEPEIQIDRFEVFVTGVDHPECVAFDRSGNLWAGGEAGQIYRISPDRKVQLVTTLGGFCGGLAFSPDESVLYIDDSARKHIRAFDVRPDGTLAGSRVLLDMTSADPGVPDGLKVDVHGNVFCTGPGGIWVCRPDGTHLGRIVLPELPANLGWGEDGSVLYVTARTSIYRLPTKTRGTMTA